MLNRFYSHIAILFFLLVSTVTVNQGVFLHSHRLTNGRIVTHAHPYSKKKDNAPLKKHQHTKEELQFLGNQYSDYTPLEKNAQVPFINAYVSFIKDIAQQQTKIRAKSSILLRAPPHIG